MLILAQLSVISIGNSIQAYLTTFYTKRIYIGPRPAPGTPPTKPHLLTKGYDLTRSEATELSTRTFGTWTLLTSVVRIYAAYRIEDPALYQLAIWTYAVAFGHFMTEWFWYKTTRFGLPLFFPVAVSTSGLIWMLSQWDFYVN